MNDHKPPTTPAPSGGAPVLLHDFIHKLQTAAQTRPRPVTHGSEEMAGVPILIRFTPDPTAALWFPEGWRLVPYGAASGFAVVVETSAPESLAPRIDPAGYAELAKLREFKEYVHARLDKAGIATHPDGPHSAQGCRIGDRLDLVLGATPVPVQVEQDGDGLPAAGTIPEFAHLPPDFFKVNTDRPAGSAGREKVPVASKDGNKEAE